MLDAYIIERIKREDKARNDRDSQIPLHIEAPNEQSTSVRKKKKPTPRGSAEVNYKL